MLRITRALLLGGCLVLLGAMPAQAQYDDMETHYRNRGFIVYGLAGGFSPLADLDQLGARSDIGYNVSGGIGYQVDRNFAIRANLSYARAQADARSIPSIDGEDFDRFFYGVDVQMRYPTDSGLAPYAVVGGGAVTVRADPTTVHPTFTRAAGKVGAGLSYDFEGNGSSLFVEWNGQLYDWKRIDLQATDEHQFDTTWSDGFRYTF